MPQTVYDPGEAYKYFRAKTLQQIELIEAKGLKKQAHVCRFLWQMADNSKDPKAGLMLRMAVQLIADSALADGGQGPG